MIFNTTFLDSLTEDENCLLYAVLNNNREVLYDIIHANAILILSKLTRAPLSDEGIAVKDSIIQKFQTATCIIDLDPLFISDEKPCIS